MAMKEWIFAAIPIVLTVYFLLKPEHFHAALQWATNLMR
jgi:hypothetical protein